jgi:type II secretory pathway component PulJ
MKRFASRRGFTLVELLTATLLTLMLMGAVATIFGVVSRSVHETRSVLEMTSRLRAAKARLQLDLEGLTVPMNPPQRPDEGKGYFELREGPMGPVKPPYLVAVNADTGLADTTVTDFDDILMGTTRSRTGPFIGRYRDTTIRSDEAEVIWFVRGRTLYRRVLLIAPQMMSDMDDNHNGKADSTDLNGVVDAVDLTDPSAVTHAFHEWYDLSARPEVDASDNRPPHWGWVPNSLGDLTKRENRYAHKVHPIDVFPFSVDRWGQLGLPTLRECANPAWMTWANRAAMPSVTPQTAIDLWTNPHPWPEVEPDTGTLAAFVGSGLTDRVGEDVILTNVIGFDVKVWDPYAPVFSAVNDNGTPADLTDDTSITSVLVVQGDPGYPLALARWVHELVTNPGNAQNTSFAPRQRGAYVDLGYAEYPGLKYHDADGNGVIDPPYDAVYRSMSTFSGPGNPRSQLTRVYDTWSLHYENDGDEGWVDKNLNGSQDPGELVGDQDMDGVIDEGTNGFDDDGDGVVDDGPDVDLNGDGVISGPYETGEWETMPPYPVPLRGIKVEIRTFEPDSRQVRAVTVVMDFQSD